ncbi:MAG: HAD family hydrolase [Oscillospiraceae bacterium]|nr:HAD family hydrolase [Oscillospiraceae bacterium]
MKYEYILFDLDGTLTDPGVGITNSVAYALRKFGLEPPRREALYPFIGPPLIDSFVRYFGFSPEQARKAVVYYREYFCDTGIYENELYDGVPALLSGLREQGRTVVLATSKPEPFARRILDYFAIAPYFTLVAGSTMAETRTGKDEVIAYALQSLGLTAPCPALMVGDRAHDILGARKVGIDSLGVLYGYGSRAELTEAGASRLAGTIAEVSAALTE